MTSTVTFIFTREDDANKKKPIKLSNLMCPPVKESVDPNIPTPSTFKFPLQNAEPQKKLGRSSLAIIVSRNSNNSNSSNSSDSNNNQ